MGALFYRLARHKFSDISLTRWIQLLLIGLAAIAGLNWQRGGWLIVLLLVAALVIFTVYAQLWRRKSYLTFVESSLPTVVPKPLKPSDKINVVVSGHFSVENKQGDFTWLQGYFRTFATREHALLCMVPSTRFALIGSTPPKDVGMWYIFFKADDIDKIRWGMLTYGAENLTGLAVTHRLFIPKRRRFQRDRTVQYTVYIGCADPAEAMQILADLLHEEKARLGDVPHQNGVGKLPHNSNAWRRIEG